MPPEDLSWIKEIKLELFIESFSNAAQTVQIRGYSETEQIIGNHTTNADRTLATSVIPITEIPLHLTARTVATGISPGECFVRVSLRGEGVVIALLSAGYVTATGSLIFPGGDIKSSVEGPGLIRSVTGTSPAGGAEIAESVPTGARWRIISIKTILSCDGTAANRVPTFIFDDGTTELFRTGEFVTLTANQNGHISLAAVGQEDVTNIANLVQCIPANLTLAAGFRLISSTAAIQAGDDYTTIQMLVEEWIEP